MGTDHRVRRFRSAIGFVSAFALGVSFGGCKRRGSVDDTRTESDASTARASGAVAVPVAPSAERPPLDRLGPGEIPPGTETVYGLVLPRGMKVIAHFPGIAHAVGALSPEDVANYVRDRVVVSRVELGAAETVFPRVRIKDGDPEKLFDIEVIPLGDRTKLVIKDMTPPTAHVPIDKTMTDAERWKRAGYNPDGTPLDPNKLR